MESNVEHVVEDDAIAPPLAGDYEATYSPEDNKIRLIPRRPGLRLDAPTYACVREEGFIWAPRQELFVAPKWTPSREDLLLELVGAIDAEESTMAERAADRAERFEGYSDKREAEAHRAREHVQQISQRFEFGQPILVGHHSERKARKDAERIQNGMRKAINLWDTANYWERRAKGVMGHAAYKANPAVRARRIKTLEAEKRSYERTVKECARGLANWRALAAFEPGDNKDRTARDLANGAGYGLWSDLYDKKITVDQACERAIRSCELSAAHAKRWIAHIINRLAYERVLLGRAPDEETKVDRTRKGAAALPLLNYKQERVEVRSRWGRENQVRRQVEMTSKEYQRIYSECRGTHVSADGTHRVRTAILGGGGGIRGEDVAVFITDSKAHPVPEPKVKPPEPTDEEVGAEVERGMERMREQRYPTIAMRPAQEEPIDPFEAMRASLKAGVQAVAVPELFVTSAPLAGRVVDEACISAGMRVLEPEAGLGALAKAARSRGATVVCVDNAPAMVQVLRREGFDTHEGDFLSFTPEDLGLFDAVPMNPPFSVEIEHVRHAWTFLKPGGRLVAIMSAAVKQNSRRIYEEFRAFVGEHGTMEKLPSGSFASAGTNVETVLVILDKPSDG